MSAGFVEVDGSGNLIIALEVASDGSVTIPSALSGPNILSGYTNAEIDLLVNAIATTGDQAFKGVVNLAQSTSNQSMVNIFKTASLQYIVTSYDVIDDLMSSNTLQQDITNIIDTAVETLYTAVGGAVGGLAGSWGGPVGAGSGIIVGGVTGQAEYILPPAPGEPSTQDKVRQFVQEFFDYNSANQHYPTTVTYADTYTSTPTSQQTYQVKIGDTVWQVAKNAGWVDGNGAVDIGAFINSHPDNAYLVDRRYTDGNGDEFIYIQDGDEILIQQKIDGAIAGSSYYAQLQPSVFDGFFLPAAGINSAILALVDPIRHDNFFTFRAEGETNHAIAFDEGNGVIGNFQANYDTSSGSLMSLEHSRFSLSAEGRLDLVYNQFDSNGDPVPALNGTFTQFGNSYNVTGSDLLGLNLNLIDLKLDGTFLEELFDNGASLSINFDTQTLTILDIQTALTNAQKGDLIDDVVGFFEDIPGLAGNLILEITDAVGTTIEDFGEVIDDVYEGAFNLYANAMVELRTAADPIVLDLDNDGVELTNALTAPVPFDITGDGVLDDLGWVAPDDGLLIRDYNGNGVVDGIGELYGDRLNLGFNVLRGEDAAEGNGDGLITVADAFWNELYVWQDTNQDGISQAGEISSLGSLGITEFDLRLDSINQENRWVEDNRIIETTTFTINGETQELAEVLFQFRSDDLLDKRGYQGGGDASLLDLPQSVGYGRMLSLQDAMAVDSVLKQLVEDFNASTDYSTLSAQVEDIILQWSGYLGHDKALRGGRFDADKLEFMEELFNTDFLFNVFNGTPNPDPFDPRSLEQLTQSWNQLLDMFTSRLAVQGPLKDAFPNADYSFATDTVTLGSTLTEIMANVAQQPYANSIGALLDIRDIMLAYPDGLGATTGQINQSVADQIAIGLGDPDLAANLLAAFDSGSSITSVIDTHWEITGSNHLTHLGTSKNDVVLGTDQQDYIAGGDGADLLLGNGGNDFFLPGTVDYIRNGIHQNGWSVGDSLFGGAGDDWFFVDVEEALVLGEEGNDTIGLAGSRAHVIDSYVDMGDGDDYFNNVYADNATLLGGDGNDSFVNGSLVNSTLDLGNGDDYYSGVIVSSSEILGGGGNDTINNGDTVRGGEGDDSLEGNHYSYGGLGNDIIYSSGVYGSAVYLDDGNDTAYAASSGNIVVTYNPGTHDTVHIGGAWASHVLDLQGFSHIDGFEDLIITDDANGNALIDLGENQFLTIEGVSKAQVDLRMFSGYANQGTFEGTENGETIHGSVGGYGARAYDGSGIYHYSSGNETLMGHGGDDSIYGEDGSDYIDGGAGNDSIYGDTNGAFYGAGFSNTLVGGLGNDYIQSKSADHDLIVITEEAGARDTVAASTASDTIDLTDFDTLTPDDLVFGYEFSPNYVEYVELGNGQRVDGIYLGHTYAFKDGVVDGGVAADILRGTAGADSMTGEGNHDELFGLAGNDTIDGGIDYDTLHGGADDDLLIGGAGNDTLNGDDGNDVLYGGIQAGSLTGDDALFGGAGNDTLFGGRGKDSIEGGDGDDEIGLAYSGDIIRAGAGNDLITESGYISYQNGQDTVYGDGGNDTIYARNGFVDAYGGDGHDSIITGNYANYVEGGNGNDYIETHTGNDTIYGGAGNDTIYAGGDPAAVTAGIDIDFVYGGDGNDEIHGEYHRDALNGEGGDDTIYGGEDRDSLSGGEGNDSLIGGSGTDYMYANEGNDTIVTGDGNDSVWGGSGNDTYEIESGFSSTVEINDFVIGEDVIDLSAFGFAFSDINNISASGGDTLININGSQSLRLLGVDSNLITEGDFSGLLPSHNIVNGTAGDDTLAGSSDADEVFAGAGNDSIFATASSDTIDGGDGIDRYYVTEGVSATIDLSLGTATSAINGTDTLTNIEYLVGYIGDDVLIGDANNNWFWGFEGNDTLEGGGGDDTLRGEGGDDSILGGTGGDSIWASHGNDFVDGEDGNDTISGWSGDDTLYGGTGNDTINGDWGNDAVDAGAGDDIVIASRGLDTLTGGDGIDTFVIENQPNTGTTTTITDFDFVNGRERIDLGAFNMTLSAVVAATTVNADGHAQINLGDGQTLIVENVHDVKALNHFMFSGLTDTPTPYTESDNIILTYASNDVVDGEDGNDIIASQDGDDLVFGAEGDDQLLGGNDEDTLIGGVGADTLNGGAGNDVLFGGDGNDDIDDRTGSDLIYAGAGDDEVTTGPDTDGAADTVYGGEGNDTILTGSGADSVFGEGGDDYISVTYGYDLVHGGDGNDTIYGDLGTASASDGDDTMYGGLGDDLLYGFGQSDLIYGGNNDANDTLDGNDTIYGRDGDDELHGEAGVDWLQGDDGDDKLYGGLGDDLFYFHGANSGNDTIYGFDGAGVALGDVIRIRSDAGATQFSDLVINPDALHNGVKIDIGTSGNSIVVADFQDTLTSGDFFFG